MEFTLFYRGRLLSENAQGSTKLKHDLRVQFSRQLWELWRHEHGKARDFYMNLPAVSLESETQAIGAFRWTSMVRHGQFAELSVTMLRYETPGAIITKGGDIDNRIKTLLDGLRVPSEGEVPAGAIPADGEEIILCLLQDDRLVTKLSIETQQFLDPKAGPNEVVLLVNARTRQLQDIAPRIGHMGF